MPKGKHGGHVKSADHPRWSDEKIITAKGYTKIRVGRDHPLADPNGYAYEHILVWVSAGNARAKEDEVIHHINGVKSDNRIENLQLLTRQQHEMVHDRLRLTDDEVVQIRKAYAKGDADQKGLAEKYGVPPQRISRIVRGKTRLNAGGPIIHSDQRKKDPKTGRFCG